MGRRQIPVLKKETFSIRFQLLQLFFFLKLNPRRRNEMTGQTAGVAKGYYYYGVFMHTYTYTRTRWEERATCKQASKRMRVMSCIDDGRLGSPPFWLSPVYWVLRRCVVRGVVIWHHINKMGIKDWIDEPFIARLLIYGAGWAGWLLYVYKSPLCGSG